MTTLALPTRRGDVQRHPGRRMSEEEFVAWIWEKTRAEWVDGEVILMAPVSGIHDELGWWLRSLVQHFVEHHSLGIVRGSEFMVRLPKQRQRRMPDVSFVAADRAAIVLENYTDGPPDLAMEVVSPGSIARDWREKFESYQRAGVKEYWIVDPSTSRMEAYTLARGGKKYRQIEETPAGIRSIVLPGFRIKPEWAFAQRRPSIFVIAKELGIS
jgi:Uma2 family endonuclease